MSAKVTAKSGYLPTAMSAAVMERLRGVAFDRRDWGVTQLRTDLRALLDAHEEALDAVQCAVEEFGWDDPTEEAHECIRPMMAVLAKAGRR